MWKQLKTNWMQNLSAIFIENKFETLFIGIESDYFYPL